MIFRIKQGNTPSKGHSSFNPMIDKYLELALTELIYAELDRNNLNYGEIGSNLRQGKGGRGSTLYATDNIPPEVKEFFAITFQNPAEREHTFLEVIRGYLDGVNFDGSACGKYANYKSKIIAFNPDVATKEGAEEYGVYKGKMGLLYQGFKYYLIYKPNSKHIYSKANEWGVLREGNVDSESGEDRVSGVVYSDSHEEIQHIDEDRFETDIDESYICKDIYRAFYEGKADTSTITQAITKTYNMVISLELNYLGLLRKDMKVGILYPEHIDSRDLEKLNHLVDKRFRESFLARDEIFQENEWQKLNALGIGGRNFELLLVFFGMLVKAGIKMEVNANEYMTTLVEFQSTTISNIHHFKEVMDATKLQSTKYPIFTLLEGTSLDEVVRNSKLGESKKKIPTAKEFEESLQKASVNTVNQNISLNITPRLKTYLEGILQLEENRYKEEVYQTYIRELAPNINENTVAKEDYQKIYRMLYPQGIEATKKAKDFINIYPVLKNEDRRLNVKDRSDAEIHDILLDLVLNPNTLAGEVNKKRLENLWKLIMNTKEHVLQLESIGETPEIELESSPLVEFLELKKHGKHSTGIKIPLLKYPTREVIVTLYNTVELKTAGVFDEGSFFYHGQKYRVTLNGAVKSVTEEYLFMAHSVNRDLEMNKEMGNDYQMIATDPLQALGIDPELIRKANSIKEPNSNNHTKSKEREEYERNLLGGWYL